MNEEQKKEINGHIAGMLARATWIRSMELPSSADDIEARCKRISVILDSDPVEEKKPSNKPPIGLMPRKQHIRERISEILAAMSRYVDEDKEIPDAWRDELEVLLCELENHK